MSRAGVCALVPLLGLALTPAAAPAQLIDVQQIVLVGSTPVPGNGGTFGGVQAPTIGPNGHVAFRSSYSGGLGNGTGIFTWDGTTLTDVARTNGPVAPGTSGNFTMNDYGTLYLPVDANGRVVFVDGYGTGNSAGRGVFTNVGGALATVARTNPATLAPGSGNPFHGFSGTRPVLSPGGRLAFSGAYTITANTSGRGLYTSTGGAPSRLADTEQESIPGWRFGNFVETFTLNAPGTAAFTGLHHSTADQSLVRWSVFTRSSGGGLAEVVSGAMLVNGQWVGTAVPGVSGALLDDFDAPVINDAGHLAFQSGLLHPDHPYSNPRGVFTTAGGGLRTIAHTAIGTIPGTVAPGTGGQQFVGFALPMLNETGRVAFLGFYGNVNNADGGLFAADAGGALTAVALPGANLGDAGTLVSLDTSALAMNAGGQIVFKGLSTESTEGIYLAEPDGTLRTVVRTGQLWDLDGNGPGTEMRTVLGIELAPTVSGGQSGLPTFFNDFGQISLALSFEDGGRGLYVVTMTPVPEPTGIVATGFAVIATAAWLRRRRR